MNLNSARRAPNKVRRVEKLLITCPWRLILRERKFLEKNKYLKFGGYNDENGT